MVVYDDGDEVGAVVVMYEGSGRGSLGNNGSLW